MAWFRNFLGVTVVLTSLTVTFADTDGMDIVILVDSSDSYRSDHFSKEKMFLQNFAKKILINDNHVALFTFGKQTDPQFFLNSYTSTTPHMLQAIEFLWFSTGDGKVATAINETIRAGFSNGNGNRECVPNALVVLTHTTITNADVIRLTRELDAAIIGLYIIDMSNSGDMTLFQQLTSRVFSINNFDSLLTSVDTVIDRIKKDKPRSGCGVLGTWQSWTPCSVSCGNGLKFRVRECKKVVDTDKDCGVELTEDGPCRMPQCIVVLDGGWSDWNSWSTCTKTCEIGVQSRTRVCDDPIPTNGGKSCVGKDIQSRQCSIWACPDCNRKCPAGGTLSSDCETCMCSSVILFGRALDTTYSPVQRAKIYLKSRQNKAITMSDEWGYFNTNGVCLMQETIIIVKEGYSTEEYTPHAVNGTHWTVNATVVKYVAPLFKTQPHDKIRLVGQSLTLCCEAVGVPNPNSYSWFKNGTELENQGTDGTLVLNNVQLSVASTYACRAETEAGVSMSDDAEIIVDDHKDDTCSSPSSKIETLPNGCFVTGSTNNDTVVDVQTCSKSNCMTRSLQDNGTCTDWWPNQCCDVDQTVKVNITCDGYSYETTKVTSCKCTLCVVKTIVSGRAFGKKDGKKQPLQLGEISYNGRLGTKTNMAGYFRFEVEKGIKRLILTFHDGIFKTFLDATRIIEITEGADVALNIILAFKPDPIPFTPSIGSDIEIGGDKGSLPPAGAITIPGNALMDKDGNSYDGSRGAKARVQFMDPRKVDDLDTAEGDFVYESRDGSKMPLRTFGMFHLGIEDHDGNDLHLNQPVTFSLDASQFNVTLDKNGNPDLALWTFDVNKGIWVEHCKMKFATSTAAIGSRKLLANVLEGTVAPPRTPQMNPIGINVTTERVITGYTNCDHNTPIYEDRPKRTPYVKKGACVVSVSAYTDFTLNQKAKIGSVTVTAFTKELGGNSYMGKKSDTVDANGHVCLDVFCDELVYIYAESAAGERLFPAGHSLPIGYPVLNNTVREVSFESRNWGTAYRCSTDPRTEVQNGPCKGPMFPYAERNLCNDHHSDASFRFKFAPFTGNPIFQGAAGDKNTFDKKLSWYPVSPSANTFRSCFLKVSLKVQDNLDNFDMRVIAVSYLEKVYGEQFGTYNVGPKPDPDSPDTSERAACIEFRCPGYVKDGTKEYFDKSTAVLVNVNTANKKLNCSITETKPGIKVTPKSSGMGFEFIAESGNNYGQSKGVYISDKQASQVDDYCHSGYMFGSKVDGLMKPNAGYAVKMFCNE